MTEYQTLSAVVEGRVGYLTLTSPSSRNAISLQTLHDLQAAANGYNCESGPDVVILGGEGPAFSAGADISNFEAFLPVDESGAADFLGGADHAFRLATAGQRTVEAIESMLPFTISAIQGYAIGAGALLALSADMRVMAEDAYFSIPETEIGTPLVWGGVQRLVTQVGPARAKDLILTCRAVPADEALAVGLVNRVVPADELRNAVDDLAEALLARPPRVVRTTKQHINALTAAARAADPSFADAHIATAVWLDRDSRALAEKHARRFRNQK
jgi:enoyl-CoA hydratase/carnithine racemase